MTGSIVDHHAQLKHSFL